MKCKKVDDENENSIYTCSINSTLFFTKYILWSLWHKNDFRSSNETPLSSQLHPSSSCTILTNLQQIEPCKWSHTKLYKLYSEIISHIFSLSLHSILEKKTLISWIKFKSRSSWFKKNQKSIPKKIILKKRKETQIQKTSTNCNQKEQNIVLALGKCTFNFNGE